MCLVFGFDPFFLLAVVKLNNSPFFYMAPINGQQFTASMDAASCPATSSAQPLFVAGRKVVPASCLSSTQQHWKGQHPWLSLVKDPVKKVRAACRCCGIAFEGEEEQKISQHGQPKNTKTVSMLEVTPFSTSTCNKSHHHNCQ